VRRRLIASLAVACVAAAGLAASASTRQTQDWKTQAVASFDDVWQTINETFPDPTFGGLDWAGVAKELRPRVESAASADAARTVIREMLARLKQSHFVLLAETADNIVSGPASVPIDIRILNGEVIVTRVTDPSGAKAGLVPGQSIVTIDGADVAALVARAQGSDRRARDLDAWRLATQRLYGEETSTAALAVRDAAGVRHDVRVSRSMGAGETLKLGNLPPLRVAFEQREARTPAGKRAGVIWFSVWMTPVSDPFEHAIDAFRHADGLVIDLRGNPGGLAAMMRGIAGHFVDQPLVLGKMHTRQAELAFVVNPRTVTADGRTVRPFAGPVALIVDELTGSTSETFAGGLQSLGRVRVFGRPSMGQALPALTRQLPNGDVLMYAVGDFVTSTGKRIEGTGVIPEAIVPLSPKALAAGHDEPLEAALRWVDEARR
jgi:carboxyl-terminal processing protease